MSERKIRIGLTGNSGSGKSTVGKILEEQGFYPIDADRVYHSLIKKGEPGYEKITAAFDGVVDDAGEIDRKKLGDLVFSDEEKRKKLNELTHPLVLSRMEDKLPAKALENGGYKGVVFDVPLLFESGAEKICDTTVAVIAPKQARIERLEKRDALTKTRILRRLASQHENDYYTKRAAHIIENTGSLASLHERVQDLVNILLSENG